MKRFLALHANASGERSGEIFSEYYWSQRLISYTWRLDYLSSDNTRHYHAGKGGSASTQRVCAFVLPLQNRVLEFSILGTTLPYFMSFSMHCKCAVLWHNCMVEVEIGWGILCCIKRWPADQRIWWSLSLSVWVLERFRAFPPIMSRISVCLTW